MQTRFILGGLIIVAIAVIAIAFFTLPNTAAVVSNTPNTPSSTNNTPATSSTTAAAPSSYTLADVAGHSNAQSCWAAINGKVYDLTNWINRHPGGPEHILALCGTDGSAAFNAQHGGQSQPASALATFYIGVLAAQ